MRTPPLAVFLSFAAILSLSALPAAAGASAAGPDPLDGAVRAYMEAHRVPGLAFSVLRDGEVVTRRAYGFANLEDEAPVRPGSVFELASLSKPMTAAAVLALVRDGRVGLDDPLSKHVPVPPDWSGIRVRHLLSHTAGLPELVELEWDGSPLFDVTKKQQLDAVLRAPRPSAPGLRGAYSDPGYFLLGCVIEAASGMRYAEYMEKAVFRPLGMTSTFVLDPARIVKGRVAPYAVRDRVLRRGRRDWSHELPSHFGVWSTLEDLERFEAGLASGRPLARETLEAMWTPARLDDGSLALVYGGPYGFGWQVGDHRGRRVVEHGGFTGTHLLRFRDDGLSVIVLSNLDLASGNAPAVLARLVAGLVDPALRMAHQMEPAADPDADGTAALLRFVREPGSPAQAARMTPVHRRLFESQPEEVRTGMAGLFRTIGGLEFLGEDVAGTRPLERLGQPVVRIRHYRASTAAGDRFFSFYLDASGLVADMRSYPRAAVSGPVPGPARR